VAEVKYSGMELTNQIIDEQMKLFLECHNHSYLNVLSSHLLFKNVKIKIHKIRLPNVVLYECETLHLAYGKNID